MRAVTLCALAALLATYATASADFVGQFEAFKAKHGRRYASADEEARRFKVFAANMRKAAELQAVNPHARFGANAFADMTEQEFKTRHNGERAFAKARRAAKSLDTIRFSEAEKKLAAGEKQDWRPKGAVTPVKNQGQCGSCWSFSTTGGIEGQWFLAGNKLTSLSEQELVSCDTIDHGCNGGLMDNAFNWLLQTHNGSIVTEGSYPYVSGDGIVPACSMTNREFGARITGFKNVADNEADMAAFVYANGPLSIAVDAESWQTYAGGVMTNCPAGQLDHGVLIVGFDLTASPKYWIIKNSWGPTWGEEGYIRVEYGTGQCSIGQYQTSSVVGKAGPTPAPGPGPTPNPGPTAPPTPNGQSFVQKTCADNKCADCSEQTFAAGACVNRAGKSFKATCATDAVIVASYAQENCGGEAVVTSNPINTCSIVFEKTGGEHFVQNECRGSGPAPGPTPNPPGPTAPPTPPTPSPAPSNGTFTQKQCTDSACTEGCQSHTFAQNQCLRLTSGGSAKAQCTATELLLTVYPESEDCTGASEEVPQALNKCEQDTSGSYIENTCSASSVARAVERSGLKAARRH